MNRLGKIAFAMAGLAAVAIIAVLGYVLSQHERATTSPLTTAQSNTDLGSDAKLLEACVERTSHELDEIHTYRAMRDISEDGVALCRQAVHARPKSAIAQEHLGRALLARGMRPPQDNTDAAFKEGTEVTLNAARAGSLWAKSQVVLFNAKEFDRNVVVQRLHAATTTRPRRAEPLVLLAQTLMVADAKMLPASERQVAFDLLLSASRMEGGPRMIVQSVHHMMGYGFCGRLVSPVAPVAHAPRSDPVGEEGCSTMLQVAASAGDDLAHMELGMLHLSNAHAASGGGKTSRTTAQARFEKSKNEAKFHFAEVARSNSVLSAAARDLLTKVDDVQMAHASTSSGEDSVGLKLFLGILGMALASPSNSGTQSPSTEYERTLKDQAERERQKCEESRTYAAYTKPDGSNEDWGTRYRAATCN